MTNYVDYDNAVELFTEVGNKRKASESMQETLLKSTVGWTGKNEFPITITSVKENNTVGSWSGNAYILNGITYTLSEDGKGNVIEIDIDGTSTGNGAFILVPYKQYTGNKIISGCNGGSSTTYELLMMSSTSGDLHCYNGDTSITPLSDRNYQARILVKSGQTLSHQKFYPMLRDASITDDTYEPYHESVEQCKFDRAEQMVLGAKNLLVYPFTEMTKTVNGITFTANSDGSITISGIATATATCMLNDKGRYFNHYSKYFGKTLIASGGISADVSFRLWQSGGDIFVNNGGDTIFTLPVFDNTIKWNFYIHVAKDADFTTPVTVYPMLRLASDPDDTYVPYAMTNRELTEEKLNISELKTIASSAADFAAFKTAIANL